MSYTNEKTGLDAIHSGLPEDAIPRLDEQTSKELQAKEEAHIGVKAVEAAEKVYGRYSKWFLFIGCVLLPSSSPSTGRQSPKARFLTSTRPPDRRIGLASYVYSLDGTTTNNYLAFAASAFDKHSLISTIQVAQSIISERQKFSLFPPTLTGTGTCDFTFPAACIGPVISKVADVTSRAMAFVVIRMPLPRICRCEYTDDRASQPQLCSMSSVSAPKSLPICVFLPISLQVTLSSRPQTASAPLPPVLFSTLCEHLQSLHIEPHS